ncbi:MAG: hypothetical protein R6W81_02295, partial [Bacteroidales bacterium]
AGTDKEEAERRFERILTGFHQFLNASSTTSGLQSRQAKWASPKGTEAFQNRKFEPEHWYTFNVGVGNGDAVMKRVCGGPLRNPNVL